MKVKVYTVFDSKSELYLPPFYRRNKGEALRSWEASCNDPESQFSTYPADFTLFEMGEFDDVSGEFTLAPAKVSLGCAIEFKKKPQQEAPLLEAIKNSEQKG